jgi:hypothetical protein
MNTCLALIDRLEDTAALLGLRVAAGRVDGAELALVTGAARVCCRVLDEAARALPVEEAGA